MSELAAVGDCLGQGTSGAGLVCAAHLDLGLQNKFNHDKDVMYYGQVGIQDTKDTRYQDDVGSICTSVAMLRKQTNKITDMLKQKTLNAHPDKSGYLILGSQSIANSMKLELKQDPIYLNKFNLKQKTEEKYLGQVIKG